MSGADQQYWLTDEKGGGLYQDFGEFLVATADIIRPPDDCNCINVGRNWYKQMIKENVIDLGFAGWMADFGEYTPLEGRSGFGARWWGQDQGEVLHQVISQEWARLNREVVEENGKLGDIMYWMRSGGVQSKFYQVMSWAGDQLVDWSQSDGLPSSIVSALSLAVSGMGLTHSDIGGYTGEPLVGLIRSKELLLRWAEYAAFTPVMRTHEGNHPEANHQFYSDDDTLESFGRLTRIYTSLTNYTRAMVQLNSDQGIPVMRPLFLMFQNDTLSYEQDYEYMYGDDLLVAPVLLPGQVSWPVYLPGPDTWVHLWSGEMVSGPDTVNTSTPLGQPPVYYRQQSSWTPL